MEESIANLILSYETANRDIDQEFFNILFDVIVQAYNVENYVSNCRVNNKLPYKACYTPFGLIEINCDKINRKLLKNTSHLPHIYKYLLYVRVILHEFSHVSKLRKKTEGTDLETQIILESEKRRWDLYWMFKTAEISILKYLIESIKISRLEQKYYRYDPLERLANIESCQIIAKIAKLLNDKRLYYLFMKEYWQCHLEGYNIKSKIAAPTKIYVEKLNAADSNWNEIEASAKKLDYISRTRLGLQATKEELGKILQIKRKLEKKIEV